MRSRSAPRASGGEEGSYKVYQQLHSVLISRVTPEDFQEIKLLEDCSRGLYSPLQPLLHHLIHLRANTSANLGCLHLNTV